jgi:hypothetical protein
MAKLEHEEQLQKIFSNVNDWLKFAEAKNFGLLTLNAGIIFGITQIDFKSESSIEFFCCKILIAFLILSGFCSLLALLPVVSIIENKKNFKSIRKFINWIKNKTGKKSHIMTNIHFYGHLRTLDNSGFEREFLTKVGSIIAFTIYEKEIGDQIIYNSRITWLKFMFFKMASNIFIYGVIISISILLFLLKIHVLKE